MKAQATEADVRAVCQKIESLGFRAHTIPGAQRTAIGITGNQAQGITVESTPVPVNPGDTILGTISSSCKAGTTYCAKWNIVSKDQTTGKKTTLSKTPSDGQIWNWAFGAVMEIYGVTECSDFPKGNKSTVFTTQVYDQNLT